MVFLIKLKNQVKSYTYKLARCLLYATTHRFKLMYLKKDKLMHNKSVSIAFVAAALAILFVLLPTASVEAHFIDKVAIDSRQLKTLSLTLPVGELTIEGTNSNQITADIQLDCKQNDKACNEEKDAFQLKQEIDGKELKLELTHEDNDWKTGNNFDKAVTVVVKLPNSMIVNLEMGVGKATINKMASNLFVDMGVGEITVNSAKADVGSVDLISGIGDVSLQGDDIDVKASRPLLVGAKLNWHQGEGKNIVDIELGVGDANVWLLD